MNNKGKTALSVIGVVFSTALLIVSAVLAENKMITPASATILITIATGFVIIAIFFAAKVEHKASVYECRKCGHTFKPTFQAYLWGAHTLTTRHLKCPKCGEKSWCKRKVAQ